MPTDAASDTHAELLMLYQVTTQDLGFFKQQQWAVTNYVLVLDAAIVGARQLVGEKLLLSIVAFMLWAVGARQLYLLERSIKASRSRLQNVKDRLSTDFRDALLTTPPKARDSTETAIFLWLVMAGGLLAVWWLV